MSTIALTRSIARRSRWAQGLLAGGLVVLGLFLTRGAEQTRDSLVYALAAKTGVDVFHPHHLIYTPVVRLFYQAIGPICPGCDAVFAGQVHNILWATVGLLALFFLVRNLWNTRVALVTTILFLGLRGFWELSTQTTMYVPGAAVLTTLSAVMVSANPRGIGLGRTALLGGLLALAILYHQANVLFVLPLGIYLLAAGGRTGLRAGLLAVALAGAVTLGAYLLVYLTTTAAYSLSGFIGFCLAYTSEICLGGLCKASPEGWGAMVNLSPAGLQQALSSLVWNVVVLPARLEGLAAPLFGLAALALAGWHAVRVVRRAADGPLRLFALIWFAAYAVFFWWWLPDYPHPFVVALVPLTLLGCLALRDAAQFSGPAVLERWGVAALACAALIIGGRNFQARIGPLHQSRGDAYHEAAALHAAAPSDCVFLTSYRTWNHLRYYFDRQTAIQARHPLSFFSLGEPLPAQYQIADKSCVFVATTFLMPTYVEEDYSDDPVNAYRNPDRWLAYLSWLLDVRPNGPGDALSSRDFSVMQFDEGDPYLRLLPGRRNVTGFGNLFGQLDSALGASARPFQSWFSLTGSGAPVNPPR